MELVKMRQTYSYIGNFTDFLINNEQRIKNLMMEYEIQTRVDTLPDGREVKSLLFSHKNINVQFTPARIDYTFNVTSQEVTFADMYAGAKDFFRLFSEIFYDLNGQRIAIVSQGFVQNNENVAIHDFTSKMGFTNVFGASNELHFKINNPRMLFESCNSVLNVDMGEAKNNKTNDVFKVLLVSFDVNTLAANASPRFNPRDFEMHFSELFEEVVAKHSAFARY